MFGYGEEFQTFEMFSLQHCMILLSMAIFITALTLFKKFFMQSKKANLLFQYIAVGILIAMEAWFWAWELNFSKDFLNVIPVEFCAMSLWFTCIGVLSKKRIFNKVAFITSTTGCLLSLLVPGMNYSFPHMRNIHYFYIHFGMWFVNFYFVVTKQITYVWLDIVKIIISVLVVGAVMIGVNALTGRNYMYLSHLPAEVSFLEDIFGIFTIPLFVLAVFGSFFATFGVYKLLQKKNRKEIKNSVFL